ncbi:hypothetical protein M8756_09250 [Lutimaribacter sp. EGI FJ00015]|uniref:Uncharacterized protein n=1 Tax=Lutimaribacter degradans TaxID=2945989 RepID=A0ACC5ZVL9_9RHOB|nr:hypothetical protein [Lutimaribacter sp. EGI FJ00013]MCM2562337.1 hypothetical protein [Lutimaribacter sp. EGI FJ00013]MCO0613492.1 hypothetical protein [Lutimaribacter sp. EGI FJ00015]MCO0636466.1 hypothetical protein [Lutimaribacter sp. EGI FJ00014]
MRNDGLNKAPDFTNAALVMGAVNLTWIFAVIWALFGMGWVVIVALLLNRAITRFAGTRRG